MTSHLTDVINHFEFKVLIVSCLELVRISKTAVLSNFFF